MTQRDLFNGNRQTLRAAFASREALVPYAVTQFFVRRRSYPAKSAAMKHLRRRAIDGERTVRTKPFEANEPFAASRNTRGNGGAAAWSEKCCRRRTMTYESVVRFPTLFAASLLAVSALAACYTGGSVADQWSPSPNGQGAATTAQSAIPGDLPCDVAQVLSDSCMSCHGSPLAGGAPNRLVSYDDLTAPSLNDPTISQIEAAIIRMKDTQKPMPPSGALPAAQVAVLEQWVAGGLPKGTCGGTSASFDTPSMCSSNQISRQEEGSSMAPGQACISCHSQGEGPRYTFAGTVYPTAHEPDDCLGVNGSSTVQVVITGADGTIHTLPVNRAGNFTLRTRIATPYTAKVVSNGKERLMATPQTNGDCNSCHTEAGANKAPGRVMTP